MEWINVLGYVHKENLKSAGFLKLSCSNSPGMFVQLLAVYACSGIKHCQIKCLQGKEI